MWILFVVEPGFQGLLEDCYDIGSVGSGDEFKGALDLLEELVSAIDGLFLQVNLVGYANARNMGTLIPHLGVPVAQVRVGHLARNVENHDADMRSKVIGRVQFIERLLSSGVPNV